MAAFRDLVAESRVTSGAAWLASVHFSCSRSSSSELKGYRAFYTGGDYYVDPWLPGSFFLDLLQLQWHEEALARYGIPELD